MLLPMVEKIIKDCTNAFVDEAGHNKKTVYIQSSTIKLAFCKQHIKISEILAVDHLLQVLFQIHVWKHLTVLVLLQPSASRGLKMEKDAVYWNNLGRAIRKIIKLFTLKLFHSFKIEEITLKFSFLKKKDCYSRRPISAQGLFNNSPKLKIRS